MQWLQETYRSAELQQVRARYIELSLQLGVEPVGPKRTQLVKELFELRE